MPEARPAVLYLCQQNPWTLTAGALIRNAWLVRALAQRYAVDLITADEPARAPDEFAAYCRSIRQFPRPRGPAARVARALRALLPGASLLTSGSVTGSLRSHVRQVLHTGAYEAVMFDLATVEALPGDGETLVYHAHNCEYQLFRRRAEIEPALLRPLLIADAKRLKRIECNVLERAKVVVACSGADLADLTAIAPTAGSKAFVAPNGVDIAGYADVRAIPPTGNTILISGSFDWRPNLIGLQWFIECVLPELERLAGRSSVEVRIAGRMSPSLAASLGARPHVVAIPNPVAMQPELARATAVVVPVLASSGTRLRILEAWAAGRPLITTTAGAFGLGQVAGRELLLEDDPSRFAAAIWRVLSEPATRAMLAKAGLERAGEYDWPVLGRRFVDELSSRLTASASF